MVCMQDGESNWLKGMTLTVAYFVMSLAFLYHEDVPNHDVIRSLPPKGY